MCVNIWSPAGGAVWESWGISGTWGLAGSYGAVGARPKDNVPSSVLAMDLLTATHSFHQAMPSPPWRTISPELWVRINNLLVVLLGFLFICLAKIRVTAIWIYPKKTTDSKEELLWLWKLTQSYASKAWLHMYWAIPRPRAGVCESVSTKSPKGPLKGGQLLTYAKDPESMAPAHTGVLQSLPLFLALIFRDQEWGAADAQR